MQPDGEVETGGDHSVLNDQAFHTAWLALARSDVPRSSRVFAAISRRQQTEAARAAQACQREVSVPLVPARP